MPCESHQSLTSLNRFPNGRATRVGVPMLFTQMDRKHALFLPESPVADWQPTHPAISLLPVVPSQVPSDRSPRPASIAPLRRPGIPRMTPVAPAPRRNRVGAREIIGCEILHSQTYPVCRRSVTTGQQLFSGMRIPVPDTGFDVICGSRNRLTRRRASFERRNSDIDKQGV